MGKPRKKGAARKKSVARGRTTDGPVQADGPATAVKDPPKADDPRPERAHMASRPRIQRSVEIWFGTLPDSPLQNIPVGPATFHRYTEIVVDNNKKLKTKRTEMLGQILKFREDHIREIRKRIERTYVGKRGPNFVCIDPTVKRYRSGSMNTVREGDVPLAEHVYFIPAEEAVEEYGHNWQRDYPASYAKMMKQTDN